MGMSSSLKMPAQGKFLIWSEFRLGKYKNDEHWNDVPRFTILSFDPDLWFLGQMKLRMVLLFLNKSISILETWFKNWFSEKKYRL